MLVRQRPGTASGVVFVTIEDESGVANLVVWPKIFEAHRRIVMGSRLLGVRGRIQREGLVIHLVAEQLWDWSADLDRIADIDGTFHLATGRGDEVRTDPGDRRVAVPKPTPRATVRARVPQPNRRPSPPMIGPHRPRPAGDHASSVATSTEATAELLPKLPIFLAVLLLAAAPAGAQALEDCPHYAPSTLKPGSPRPTSGHRLRLYLPHDQHRRGALSGQTRGHPVERYDDLDRHLPPHARAHPRGERRQPPLGRPEATRNLAILTRLEVVKYRRLAEP